MHLIQFTGLAGCVCVCNSCSEGCRIDRFRSHVSRGAVDILEGTAQRRPFQFVVIWIGDAQSTHLLVLWEIRIDRYVVRREKQKQEQVTLTQTTSHGMTGQQVCVCVCVCVHACEDECPGCGACMNLCLWLCALACRWLNRSPQI